MKRTIIVCAVLVLTTVTGIAVYMKWSSYKNQQLTAQASASVKAATASLQSQQNARDEIKQLQADNATLATECLKGSNAYALLTAQQKAKIPAPSCQSNPVE